MISIYIDLKNNLIETLLLSRNFPLGFGQKLVQLWEESQSLPRTDMRQKETINPYMTDHDLFKAMPLGDLWSDAGVVETFLYLISNKNCRIPDGWLETMTSFREELQQMDPRLYIVLFFDDHQFICF